MLKYFYVAKYILSVNFFFSKVYTIKKSIEYRLLFLHTVPHTLEKLLQKTQIKNLTKIGLKSKTGWQTKRSFFRNMFKNTIMTNWYKL